MKLKQNIHNQKEAEKKRINSEELQIVLALCINYDFNDKNSLLVFYQKQQQQMVEKRQTITQDLDKIYSLFLSNG